MADNDLVPFPFRVLTAGRQLAKSLELQSLNDLGFSKRYVRCLQVSCLMVYDCSRCSDFFVLNDSTPTADL